MRPLCLISVIACLASRVCGQNLLQNGDFESSDFAGNWFCKGGCTMSQSAESYSGGFSVLVTNRNADWKGVAQSVELVPGSMYKMTAWAKLLDTANNKLFQSVSMTLHCKDASGVNQFMRMGTTPKMVVGEWRQVGGVIRIPEGYNSCSMYVTTTKPASYYLDEASAELVPDDDDWKTSAYQRIDELRRRNINVNVMSSGKDPVSIEIRQRGLEFALGSAVSASHITEPTSRRYQEVFYNNFEWGVLENSLKWRMMERTEGIVDYGTPLSAMSALLRNGVKARCHCAVWGKDTNVPEWLKGLSADDLRAAVSKRIQGVTMATKGMCEQWDVNNENLPGEFFERQTGDVNVSMEMFHGMKSVDPIPELYLNDYSIVSGSTSTVAIKDVAVRYVQAGVPVAGIGIQSHLHHSDVQLIKARLDIVAEAGLPIMITEFAMNDKNATTKAEKLTDVLTLMFSHPAVKGILLWGFWDGKIWEEDAALYEGDDVTPNAAGLAYEKLFHQDWRTTDIRSLSGNTSYTMRAFQGDYTITVRRQGQVLSTSDFRLSDQDVAAVVQVGDTTVAIN